MNHSQYLLLTFFKWHKTPSTKLRGEGEEARKPKIPWILYLVPRGAYLFQAHLKGGGGLIETGGLFNLEKTMVSVLQKKLEYKVEKLKNKKVGGHAAEDQNQKLPV